MEGYSEDWAERADNSQVSRGEPGRLNVGYWEQGYISQFRSTEPEPTYTDHTAFTTQIKCRLLQETFAELPQYELLRLSWVFIAPMPTSLPVKC